jgi:CHASE1-domain containing sensor protein
MAVLPIVVICLSIAIFFTLWRLENQNAKASFDIVAQERFDALESNVTLTLHSLVSLGAFYDSSISVERAEFARFAQDLLARDNAIQALEWIPRTPNRLRADRENSAHRDGFPSFLITERLPQGQLARAGDRDEYFPVFFVEPLNGNQKALGFDLASDAVRNEALRRSAATGSLVATGRVRLVQETADQYGFLVFRPVYQGGIQPLTAKDRRERLVGFILAAFRIGDIIEKAGAVTNAASGLHVAVFDADAKRGERLLYPKGALFDGVGDLASGFSLIREIPVAGRRWVMTAYPASALEQSVGARGRNAIDRPAGRLPAPQSQTAAGDRTQS